MEIPGKWVSKSKCRLKEVLMTFRHAIAEGAIAVAKLAPPVSRILLSSAVHRLRIPAEARYFVTRLANELNHRIVAVATLPTGDQIRVVWTDFIGQEIYYDGCYEPETVAMIGRTLQPGSVFLDIGSHVGQYSVIAARKVGPGGAVHAFEPDPETFQLLSENVTRLTNLQANQIALSDHDGTDTLYLADAAHIGFNSLQKPHECATERTCEVKTKTLDHYLSERAVRHVDFIKMDVEGGELNVLAGATKLFEVCKPAVLLEFNPKALAQFGHTCEDLENFLRQRGYDLHPVDGPSVPGSTRKAVFNMLATHPMGSKNAASHDA
jgi:FkbM family methyltransferase